MERRLAAIFAADVAGYSRMMGADEAGTLAALQAHHAELIAPAVAEHRGRIVKRTGDGILVEFGSVVEAVACAVQIQRDMAQRNAAVPAERRMNFRIGVHLGDVIIENDDIFGDGVNIAARLESIADSGGICISRQAYDQVDGKVPCEFKSLGRKNLKNIAKPVEAFAVEIGGGHKIAEGTALQLTQEINYCRAPDGVRLAWAKVGSGPPLVKAANWMNHLEYDWESPAWRHILHGVARNHTLIRYDQRGNGLSDWDVANISFDVFVSDLEAVVDAAGIERFALLGISQGCAVSIAYAVRHPERVSHLVLYGGFATGFLRRTSTEAEKQEFAALATLIRLGWGKENPAFRQMFTSQFIPGGTQEQIDSFNELQRIATSPDCAARIFEANGEVDVTALLPRISCPTLVLHARGDARMPFELGRQMAAAIPGARFVALQGQNHVLLEGEPASIRFMEEVTYFLGGKN